MSCLRNLCLLQAHEGSLPSFPLQALTFHLQACSLFGIDFCVWREVAIEGHFPPHGYSVGPASFIAETILSSALQY